MTSMRDREAMRLDDREAIALAHLVAARHIHHTEAWLEWEDYPNLDQDSFERLNQAVRTLALHHSEVSKSWQRTLNVEAGLLFEKATA